MLMKNILYVENYIFASVKKYSFSFRNVITKKTQYIPFEDVDHIIFDHPKSYFTSEFVMKCQHHNIGIIFCNEKHVPTSTLYSEYNHFKKLERLNLQIQLPQRFKNRLWRKIVKEKIKNQALALFNSTKNKPAFNQLMQIETTVESNDHTNREAYASRIYFQSLFGKDFKRGRYGDPVNKSLNYTYAIIRAHIRKHLCAHGFEPSLGIKHNSSENPFNLSDDLIELYRPLADQYIYEHIKLQNIKQINKETKKLLISILMEKCLMDNEVIYISDAIVKTVQSLIKSYQEKSVKHFKIPIVIEGGP